MGYTLGACERELNALETVIHDHSESRCYACSVHSYMTLCSAATVSREMQPRGGARIFVMYSFTSYEQAVRACRPKDMYVLWVKG